MGRSLRVSRVTIMNKSGMLWIGGMLRSRVEWLREVVLI